ncbi:hypothetical protein DIU36_19710, partial [Mucilaginibacter rubeus]
KSHSPLDKQNEIINKKLVIVGVWKCGKLDRVSHISTPFSFCFFFFLTNSPLVEKLTAVNLMARNRVNQVKARLKTYRLY